MGFGIGRRGFPLDFGGLKLVSSRVSEPLELDKNRTEVDGSKEVKLRCSSPNL